MYHKVKNSWGVSLTTGREKSLYSLWLKNYFESAHSLSYRPAARGFNSLLGELYGNNLREPSPLC